MSGAAPDPLDRIAENARYAPNKPRRYPSWGEVEALVEVARAARDEVSDNDWCFVCFEHPSRRHAKNCALARLEETR